MSEPTPIREILFGRSDEETEPQSAVDPSATANTEADEGDELTIDEALAALEGTDAPQATQAQTDASVDPTAALTPEQIAALLAENEQYKAREAKVSAEQAVEDFETRWGDFYWDTIDVYKEIEDGLRQQGAKAGASQAEIDAVVHNRVYLGNGLKIPGTNKPMTGRLDWERDTLFKYGIARSDFLVAQGQQSVDPIVAIAQQYNLDASDTQTLATLRDLPKDQVEKVAQALGAKNQRVNSTLSQATQEANLNVARSLSQGQIAPGVPGATAPKKPYQFKHTPDVAHKETQYVVNKLFRRAG